MPVDQRAGLGGDPGVVGVERDGGFAQVGEGGAIRQVKRDRWVGGARDVDFAKRAAPFSSSTPSSTGKLSGSASARSLTGAQASRSVPASSTIGTASRYCGSKRVESSGEAAANPVLVAALRGDPIERVAGESVALLGH